MNNRERHEVRYQRRKQRREEKVAKRSEQFSKWNDVFGFDSLVNGYKACAKASKNRTATQIWMSNLALNTRNEEIRLASGKWKSRGFNSFSLKERGKWRDILSVHISEKGIQNSFCNNCLIPLIRPHLIYDNGASLADKGTDFALDRFTKHLQWHIRKYGLNGYIYFFDFSRYFANIQNDSLIKNTSRFVKSEEMMNMFKTFVGAFGDVGLGLGSQVSQISAVFYPNEIDHVAKDELGVKCYGRYMDDGYIICNDINELKRIVERFKTECEKYGIILNSKKCQIVKISRQFKFLKTRFFITESGKIIRRINRETARCERHRLKCFRKFYDLGIMSYEEIFLNFHSWLLSLNRGKSYHVKLNAVRYFNDLFPEFEPYYPPKITERKHKVLKHIAIEAARKR